MRLSRQSVDRILLSFTVIALLATTAAVIDSRTSRTSPPPAEPLAIPEPGADTLLVFLLSSGCPACRAEPNATNLRLALERYSSQTTRARTLGAAIDNNVQAALAYLTSVGTFDQISAGGGWTNQIAHDFIWPDTIPLVTVPQVLVISRRVTAPVRGRRSMQDSVVERLIGMPPIIDWLNRHSN